MDSSVAFLLILDASSTPSTVFQLRRTDSEVCSRPPNEYIPPVQDPYTYIIFRASEVKDLAVDDTATQRRNVHDDPAVIGVSPPSFCLLHTIFLSLMKPLTDVTNNVRLSESA